MKPKHRYIMPGDHDKKVTIEFSRAELITLLNILVEEIGLAEKQGAAFQDVTDLAAKLEYLLSDQE